MESRPHAPPPSDALPRVCLFADFPVGALEGEAAGRGVGQVATWFPQLARAFGENRELDLHWCVLCKHLRREKTLRVWNQTFHLLPGGRLTTGLLFNHWLPRRAFRRFLGRLRPDLIHCWGTENLNSSALWEFDGPSILSMQGIIEVCFRAGDLPGWRWGLMRAWEPRALARAELVTSESAWGVEQLRALSPGLELRQIEYGVAESFFNVAWSPDPARPRILFAGTLNRIKGFDILLDLLARRANPPWTLVVAGSGPLEARLRALHHPAVEFRGLLTTRELQAEMSRSWALVLPSRADSSPNVVKEARVIGLPVVVSPHGGHSAYVRDGVDGRRVDSGVPQDWAGALDAMAADLDRCRVMGARGREAYREMLRPGLTAEAFLRLYRERLSLSGR